MAGKRKATSRSASAGAGGSGSRRKTRSDTSKSVGQSEESSPPTKRRVSSQRSQVPASSAALAASVAAAALAEMGEGAKAPSVAEVLAMTVKDLKAALVARKTSTSGKKFELQERLFQELGLSGQELDEALADAVEQGWTPAQVMKLLELMMPHFKEDALNKNAVFKHLSEVWEQLGMPTRSPLSVAAYFARRISKGRAARFAVTEHPQYTSGDGEPVYSRGRRARLWLKFSATAVCPGAHF